jgi:lipoprotein-anchoring transpeptidase ErfK/SrfK
LRKPILNLMSALLATSFLINLSGVADARHLQKRHHAHHHYHHKAKAKKHRRRPALPPIVIAEIDISTQTMNVTVSGYSYGNWKVSTARAGYSTPRGSFRVQRMAKVYFSKKYDNSPMPSSVFFSGGNAIHGTNHLRSLGRPASHGCVRLAPSNAATLFSLIKQYGPSRARVVVHQ